MSHAQAVLRFLRRDDATAVAEPLGPVGSLVEDLLAEAIRRGASDLHLDPTPTGTRIRLRVDGFFEDSDRLPGELHERVVARLKVLAGLTVYRRDEVQEGAIRREGGIDLRVSVLPTVAGEKVTLRVFDPAVRPLDLDRLGYRPDVVGLLTRLAELRQGAVLLAGPSGSGKTTALYALTRGVLAQRGDHVNVCSVEDPVEFALAGVHQVAVNRERGLTFARGLAALLRQDPEVILVGEVRDGETAGIAVEAGMTGHLVLSSVHAGRAAEALTRLLDLGVEPYLVATSVKWAIAQRLIRRICDDCARPDRPAPALLRSLQAPEDGDWRRGAGCAACRGTGYRGRLPILEALEVDRAVAARLLAREEAAALGGSLVWGRSILDDGIERARAGETTLEEVSRVLDRAEVSS